MNRAGEPELRWRQQGAVFLGALVLLASRRPDAVFNAQFYAEDGRVFFEDAYNLGWRAALIHPYGGYFHAVPRLTAALALLVPLFLAPLVMNLVALGLQALPVNLLLSQRSSSWGSFRARLLMAGLYLALPNCGEASANITNAQCSMALIALLLLLASPPSRAWSRCAECLFLLLFGLSGPYCILLLPIAAALLWSGAYPADSSSKRSGRWRWLQLAILTATAVVEGWSLLFLDREGRMHYALGATWAGLARILGGQIYFGALFGPNRLGVMTGFGPLLGLVCAVAVCSAVVAVCFLRSGIELRSLLAFSWIVLGASLVSPMILTAKGQTLWQVLVGAAGEHYWLFPILAFAWSLAQGSRDKRPWLRFVCAYLLFVMCIGIIRDWKHPVFKDLNFAASAKRFDSAPPGTVADFALNPKGWKMQLVKR